MGKRADYGPHIALESYGGGKREDCERNSFKTLSHSENGWDLNKNFSEFKGVNIALNVTAGFLRNPVLH